MHSSPFTEIGRIQTEVNDIKRKIQEKANSHELYEIQRKISNLESKLNAIDSVTDTLLDITSRLENLEYANDNN